MSAKVLDLSGAARGLRLLYVDVASIFRATEAIRPNGTSEITYVLIQDGVACRLSQPTKQPKEQNEPEPTIKRDADLFCDKTVDIRAGDKVLVKKEGDEREYYVGDVFTYASHLEVALQRKVDA